MLKRYLLDLRTAAAAADGRAGSHMAWAAAMASQRLQSSSLPRSRSVDQALLSKDGSHEVCPYSWD